MEIHVNLSILRNVFPIFSIKDLFKSPIEFMEGFEKKELELVRRAYQNSSQ